MNNKTTACSKPVLSFRKPEIQTMVGTTVAFNSALYEPSLTTAKLEGMKPSTIAGDGIIRRNEALNSKCKEKQLVRLYWDLPINQQSLSPRSKNFDRSPCRNSLSASSWSTTNSLSIARQNDSPARTEPLNVAKQTHIFC